MNTNTKLSDSVRDIQKITQIYKELIERPLNSLQNFENWIKDTDTLDACISEEMGWRYINMTRYTNNLEYQKKYQEYITKVIPKVNIFSNELQKKLVKCPFLEKIKNKGGYKIWIKKIDNELKLFREKNIKIFSELNLDSQKYSTIVSKMTIEHENKEYTLQQAAIKLESKDRNIRKTIYDKISQRRLKDKHVLDNLFSDMIQKRNQISVNSNFDNFIDYMFVKLNRFDYSKEDCYEFHKSVKKEVVPINNLLIETRKDKLQLPTLKPWDLSVDIFEDPPLKPFKNQDDLLKKTITVFNNLDPFFGDCIKEMKDKKHLDLGSRKNKAPGGYNYPLLKTGIPFIFMNVTHTFDDMITMLHEGGHAIHSFLIQKLPLNYFKEIPMEVAEVASMSMELLSMEYWDVFFDNYKDLLRAKYLQFARVISILPWVATIDKFQHWIYKNPNHNPEDRKRLWNQIFDEFSSELINWEGQENYKDYLWQKQLHLYEVPFYYIEYAISQLAAIAIWKNFKENKKDSLGKYIEALKVGSMKTISEIYEIAGIKFSFSQYYIKELMEFIKKELLILKKNIEDI